jgi:hypothetical protein
MRMRMRLLRIRGRRLLGRISGRRLLLQKSCLWQRLSRRGISRLGLRFLAPLPSY